MKKTLLLAATLFTGFASFAENNTESTTAVPAATIEKEATAIGEPSPIVTEEYYYERRFSAITELGTVIAYNKPFFNIYQAVGVRINPYVFIGQGIGIQVSSNKLYQIQATADLRAYVLDKKVTPMFTVQAGLNKVGNVPENEKVKLNDTQFTMNLGTGILVKAKENASFTVNGGYTIFTDFNASIHGGFVKVGYVF